MVEQLNKSELDILMISIQRGPAKVIGFERNGQRSAAPCRWRVPDL